MFDRSYLKTTAREQIKGKIGILFLCTLISLGILSLSGTIPGIGSVVAIVVNPIISFGIILIYLDVVNGINVEIPTLFKGFGENFSKIWITYFLMELYIALWSLLFVIPGIIKGISYSMAPYILAENPHLTPSEALKQSKEMTNGYKMDLFILELSFIGWILLGAITFGIAYVYVLPYMQATFTNAYYELKNNCDAYSQSAL